MTPWSKTYPPPSPLFLATKISFSRSMALKFICCPWSNGGPGLRLWPVAKLMNSDFRTRVLRLEIFSAPPCASIAASMTSPALLTDCSGRDSASTEPLASNRTETVTRIFWFTVSSHGSGCVISSVDRSECPVCSISTTGIISAINRFKVVSTAYPKCSMPCIHLSCCCALRGELAN